MNINFLFRIIFLLLILQGCNGSGSGASGDNNSSEDVTISIAPTSVVEGNAGTTNLIFTVTLSAVSDGAMVDFASSDMTATTADNDYVAKTGTITFTGGSTSETIQIVINGDITVEQDEGLTLTLSDPTGGIKIGQASAIGVITNDDADITPPVITLNGSATVTVELNGIYNELGATAVDYVDGVLIVPGPIVLVDVTTVGDYILAYTIADAAGNGATVFRTVTVIDSSAQTTFSLLNDTGVARGGNYPSGSNATCIGETIAQQDCSFGRDASSLTNSDADGRLGFSFTKLDASGNELLASATTWSCVKDNVTGLIWEVKNTDANSIHLNSKIYRWGGKGAQITEGVIFGERYDSWDTLVDGSNTEQLCGFSDWRVPNRETLRSIVDYSSTSFPAIDTDYFPNAAGSVIPSYWSSSPSVDPSVAIIQVDTFLNAWGIDAEGNAFSNGRSQSNHVRLVRGN